MKALFRNLIASLYQRLVVRLIHRNGLIVVAVAGSVGKTTTKRAIASVLGTRYGVLAHDGNYNSQLGVPLSVFEQEVPDNLLNIWAWIRLLYQANRALYQVYPYQVLLLELGTDHPGEIADFAYLRADYGVITAIAPEHMEHFRDLDAVADEEFAVAGYSRTLVLNQHFHQLKVRAAGRDNVVWYGKEAADFAEAKAYPAPIRQALSAAVVIARHLELSEHEIRAGIAAFVPVAGRMVELSGIKGTTLIDDTYNSSPEAVKAAMATLSKVKGRRIAVMGQMNELGDQSPAYHDEVGSYCTEVDLLVTLAGDANEFLGPAAVRAGLAPSRLQAFDSPYEAGKWLRDQLQPGDTVLIKGSQNQVFAEEVTKLLLADPADAWRLVRQSPSWLRRKAEQFGVQ